MSDYLQLLIGFEGEANQEKARVLRSMVVENLIRAVCQRYERPAQGVLLYHLADGHMRPLVSSRTLGQNDVPDGAVLILRREVAGTSPTRRLIDQNYRIPLESTIFVCVEIVSSGQQFPLRWQPAIIGRKDPAKPERNMLVAVDLSRIPGAQKVSRHHACITRNHGQYYIESIHDSNPTFLGHHKLTPWQPQPIQPGSRISVGGITMIFKLTE